MHRWMGRQKRQHIQNLLLHMRRQDLPGTWRGVLKNLTAGAVVLQDASHQLVMITGDTPLTACHAAKQVHIVDRPVLILDYHRSAPVMRLTVPQKPSHLCIGPNQWHPQLSTSPEHQLLTPLQQQPHNIWHAKPQ